MKSFHIEITTTKKVGTCQLVASIVIFVEMFPSLVTGVYRNTIRAKFIQCASTILPTPAVTHPGLGVACTLASKVGALNP